MKLRLKPLGEQVIVITGASTGIGLVTAKAAARRGARVVLAARNENDLRVAIEVIRRSGGRAVYVFADVSDPAQVETIAATARREFGGIDTWVNNAAVSMYGRLTELSTGAACLCTGGRVGGHPARRAASVARARRGRLGSKVERRPVRPACRRSLYGAVDVCLPEDRQAGGRPARQPLRAFAGRRRGARAQLERPHA